MLGQARYMYIFTWTIQIGFFRKIPVLHYSQERFDGFKGYAEVVDRLRPFYGMRVLYTKDIVFHRNFIEKKQ